MTRRTEFEPMSMTATLDWRLRGRFTGEILYDEC
jgi:hypothetical protein